MQLVESLKNPNPNPNFMSFIIKKIHNLDIADFSNLKGTWIM